MPPCQHSETAIPKQFSPKMLNVKSQDFKLTDISLQESQIQLLETEKFCSGPLDMKAEYDELFANRAARNSDHHRSIIYHNETHYIRNEPSATTFRLLDKPQRYSPKLAK